MSILYQVLMDKTEDEELLSKWKARIISSLVEYKQNVEELRKLKGDEAWEEKYADLKGKILVNLPGEDVELMVVKVPNSFSVKPISDKQYTKIFNESHFGFPIPDWYECDI